jgi:hypothetical protein
VHATEDYVREDGAGLTAVDTWPSGASPALSAPICSRVGSVIYCFVAPISGLKSRIYLPGRGVPGLRPAAG